MSFQPFYHLDHFPLLPKKYIDPAFESYYAPPSPENDGMLDVRSLLAPADDFKKTRLFYDLTKTFGSAEAAYSRNNPMTYYEWHKDLKRNTGINWLLTEQTSYTLYTMETGTRLTYQVVNLEYRELYHPVLLDTSVRHCVLNLSPKPRYILTVGINDPSVTFADVKEYLEKYTVSNPY